MKSLLLSLFVLITLYATGQITVVNPTVETLKTPRGIDTRTPRFSWQIESPQRGIMQTAYEIAVASESNEIVWSSGKVSSDRSSYVDYAGMPLESGSTYYWKVRIWDNLGQISSWSDTEWYQTGLFDVSDWKAMWIEPGYEETTIHRASPLLRKVFKISKKISSATAYITAHGLYEANINGMRVGDSYFTPGFTSYNKRLQYQQYDVTDLIQRGNNVIGVVLASGWYRGLFGANKQKGDGFGSKLGLLCQIDIHYSDGSSELVVSDRTWSSATGEIVDSEIYNGEMVDANKRQKDWLTDKFDDQKWTKVKVASYDNSILVSTYNEPVRKHEVFTPVKVIVTPQGEQVIDFGQNLTGWEIAKLEGKKGDTIRIFHAEVLDKNGNFYTANLRSAKATSTYIFGDNGKFIFEPKFTFYGFRYIKVEGLRGKLNPDDFSAVALYSDMPSMGSFACSDKLVNQLQHNIEWGLRGNFLDIPTDCPQRDEREGWTGDAQVFFRTATYLRKVNNFFVKWLKDVAAEQAASGMVSHVTPNCHPGGGSAGWGDAATIIPYQLYWAYGDKRVLEEQYESMKGLIKFMQSRSHDNLWNKGNHFGDWLAYPLNADGGKAAPTDKFLIAQCFFAHSTQIVINTAKILGKDDDGKYYEELLSKIKSAYFKKYVTANGDLISPTQTAYVLALQFDILPESQRHSIAKRLVDNIKSYNYHLTTGFLGTPYLADVLTQYGYSDIAYKLLLQKTYPSWLFPITMGATTIWERWDGIKPNGDFQSEGMNSFNHYAYGAIGDWLYRSVAGITQASPGYKNIVIKPYLGAGLTNAEATYLTLYGPVSSKWEIKGNTLEMDVTIPCNTTATLHIPNHSTAGNVTESGKPLQSNSDIKIISKQNSYTEVVVGSGKYSFMVK